MKNWKNDLVVILYKRPETQNWVQQRDFVKHDLKSYG
jgi:hypothetical protein